MSIQMSINDKELGVGDTPPLPICMFIQFQALSSQLLNYVYDKMSNCPSKHVNSLYNIWALKPSISLGSKGNRTNPMFYTLSLDTYKCNGMKVTY